MQGSSLQIPLSRFATAPLCRGAAEINILVENVCCDEHYYLFLCRTINICVMSRKTFGKIMPKSITQNLELMGEQIMLARKRRHLSMQDVADRATVTRLTVSKVEHGDPTVALGIYARVLFALNLENDLKLIAGNDPLGRDLQDAELKK
jgi:DNA-binding XRE family transcriptional regulator